MYADECGATHERVYCSEQHGVSTLHQLCGSFFGLLYLAYELGCTDLQSKMPVLAEKSIVRMKVFSATINLKQIFSANKNLSDSGIVRYVICCYFLGYCQHKHIRWYRKYCSLLNVHFERIPIKWSCDIIEKMM